MHKGLIVFCITLLFTMSTLSPTIRAGSESYKIIIHPGEIKTIWFNGDVISLTADNWLNDRIGVQHIERYSNGINNAGIFELSKNHPLKFQRASSYSQIGLVFTNRNALDFTILAIEQFSGGNLGTNEREGRLHANQINLSAEEIVDRDNDFLIVKRIVNETQRPSISSMDGWYRLSKCKYLRFKYHLGRISYKLGVLAHVAGAEHRYSSWVQSLNEYVVNADQRRSAPAIEPALVDIKLFESPQERFQSELYNVYLIEFKNASTSADYLFAALMQYAGTSDNISDIKRVSEQDRLRSSGVLAFQQGVHDAGGSGTMANLASKFAHLILLPIFADAGRTGNYSNSGDAKLVIISFISEIGQVDFECRDQ